jgi:hypothetical protein
MDSVAVSPADQPFTVWQGMTIFTMCVSLMTTSFYYNTADEDVDMTKEAESRSPVSEGY